jgi:hypothetical protein
VRARGECVVEEGSMFGQSESGASGEEGCGGTVGIKVERGAVDWICCWLARSQNRERERQTETERQRERRERGSPTVAQAKKHNQSFALASPRPMGSDQPVKK